MHHRWPVRPESPLCVLRQVLPHAALRRRRQQVGRLPGLPLHRPRRFQLMPPSRWRTFIVFCDRSTSCFVHSVYISKRRIIKTLKDCWPRFIHHIQHCWHVFVGFSLGQANKRAYLEVWFRFSTFPGSLWATGQCNRVTFIVFTWRSMKCDEITHSSPGSYCALLYYLTLKRIKPKGTKITLIYTRLKKKKKNTVWTEAALFFA